ncbi:glycoside hydrolase family 3 protein [Aquimarina algicola]|nr:glycoside hydrolase family 3 N-terminal domain-containing protein [Aquimarina algicola]
MAWDKETHNISKTEKIGQLFFPAAFINDSDQEIKKVEELITNHYIGGLTFFHSRASAATNFEGKQKVIINKDSLHRLSELIQHYQSIATTPLLMSIDAEWGLAMRVENTPQYPYAITLGALPKHQEELIYKVGQYIGQDLASIGIHFNLAPVADTNTNPNNPVIGYRSFGEDKEHVVSCAISYYKGLKDSGVLGCFKHFPGHGDTLVDSHLGLPVLSKSREDIDQQELYPFRTAIAHDIDSIMIGHLAIPALTEGKNIPATLSSTIIKDILREELGYKGVVISDALNMHSVSKLYPQKGHLEWQAFYAGNDILCFSEHVEEGIRTIEKNASDAQIEKSYKRVSELKKKAFTKAALPSKIDSQKAESLNLDIAKAALTAYKYDENSFKNFLLAPFDAIMIGNRKQCHFFDEISKHVTFKTINSEVEVSANQVLIALFPPAIKPKDSFGINSEDIDTIERLSQKKNVLIYIFGNPYATQVFQHQHINNIILMYQDFLSFQHIATQHFLGGFKAVGSLPVTL